MCDQQDNKLNDKYGEDNKNDEYVEYDEDDEDDEDEGDDDVNIKSKDEFLKINI